MGDTKKRIRFLSEAYCGSVYDYAMLKTEKPPDNRIWFDTYHIHVDLGFLGIVKDYPTAKISIFFKKIKKQPINKLSKKR